MSSSAPLPGFDDRAPRDRYCDLILTGGVTSAIAYPAAIFALATTYRFNSIGGSSSGAGSAALAAAAEFRRRHGSSDGFRILLERTSEVADEADGRTKLAWLFQPEPRNERLFNALVPGIAQPDNKKMRVAEGLLDAYAFPIFGAIVVASALVAWLSNYWGPQGVIAYACASLIAAVVAAGFAFWGDVACIVESDYGMCNGMARLPDVKHPTLTEWLHELIQEIAGRSGGPPLTFADLASAPGAARDTLGNFSIPKNKSIGLQMFTANVTHARPYVLPQGEDEAPLYFRPSEMRRLFPEAVVNHMKDHSKQHIGEEKIIEPKRRAAPWFLPWRKTVARTLEADDAPLWLLPKDQLPIIVACRMSVSFPVLFTAVPLWVLDDQDKGKPKVFRRCLFSDGSLCSNFPIHFFDSVLPAWPTFGISLYDLPANKDKPASDDKPAVRFPRTLQNKPLEDRDDKITLPHDHRGGMYDRWNDFEDRRTTGDRLFGFVGALFSTTKDWNDATLARLPGVRDRVARVGLDVGIGGLNIRMNSKQIRILAKCGGKAARKLLDRFAKPSAIGGTADGWNEHRWVRFNLLRECLAEILEGFSWSAAQTRYAKPLHEHIRGAIDEAPLKEPDDKAADGGKAYDSPKLLAAQAAELDALLAVLMQAERALTASTVKRSYKPYPRPALRIRPPL